MTEQEMREIVRRILRQAVYPAALGLGLALTPGCRDDTRSLYSAVQEEPRDPKVGLKYMVPHVEPRDPKFGIRYMAQHIDKPKKHPSSNPSSGGGEGESEIRPLYSAVHPVDPSKAPVKPRAKGDSKHVRPWKSR